EKWRPYPPPRSRLGLQEQRAVLAFRNDRPADVSAFGRVLPLPGEVGMILGHDPHIANALDGYVLQVNACACHLAQVLRRPPHVIAHGITRFTKSTYSRPHWFEQKVSSP